MAVFTSVTLDELQAWLTEFDIGEAVDFRGITSGVENTNFFLSTRRKDGAAGEYVLTLFERLEFQQLPFYLYLMEHLSKHGVPVPAPIPGRDGEILRPLKGKPACIVTRLPGIWVPHPSAWHCAEVGAYMARMHLAGSSYTRRQPNLRSLPWWRETVPQILPFLQPDQATLLQEEMHFQENFFPSPAYEGLPYGPSHCDLFRDNALFTSENGRDKLGGFFDFYFAGSDKWLFDIAVAVNDWCVDLDTGALDAERTGALLRAYHQVRQFAPDEEQSWAPMLRAAALRFWISRLWDFRLPRSAELLKAHDPAHFERILRLRVEAPPPWLKA